MSRAGLGTRTGVEGTQLIDSSICTNVDFGTCGGFSVQNRVQCCSPTEFRPDDFDERKYEKDQKRDVEDCQLYTSNE